MDAALQLRTGDLQFTNEEIINRNPDDFGHRLTKLWFLYFLREFETITEIKHEFNVEVLDVQRWYYPKTLFFGLVYHALNDMETSREYFNRARLHLENHIEEHPDDPRIRAALGRAYAGLGMKDEAIAEGKKAMELMPVSQDALAGTDFKIEMAKIYTMTGEHDLAFKYIESLLSIPADFISTGMLQIDPDWDPLRNSPEFQSLLRDFE